MATSSISGASEMRSTKRKGQRLAFAFFIWICLESGLRFLICCMFWLGVVPIFSLDLRKVGKNEEEGREKMGVGFF